MQESICPYNAKAHPHLSKEGHLLVSYNVNGKNYGTNEIYRSRWLELDLNTLSESPILSNVSSHKPVEASGWISADTEPRFAVDEVWQKRWEDDTPGDKWLQIDLEQNYYISKYILRTSTWNGSDSKYNTRDWKLSVSVDGENWTEVDTVTDNTAGKVVRTFDEIQARYVRLDITKAAQAGFDKAVVDAISIYGVAVPLKDKRINVALKKEVTASGGQDSAAKLVDGNYSDVNTDKWCDTSTGDKWIQVDLGEKQRISKYVVRHAGVAEATRYNTNCFKLQASNDGKRWVNIDQVDFNMHNITSMEVKPFKARYVRLYITKPTLSRNDVARIYELELYADEKKLVDKTELQEAFSKQ